GWDMDALLAVCTLRREVCSNKRPLTKMLLFFYLIILRPPTPTLFPYTTLFRSEAVGKRIGLLEVVGGQEHGRAVLPKRSDLVPQDRKSTRLNSSHSQISYAVFCLKKKKNSHPTSLRIPIIASQVPPQLPPHYLP